jgi:hypothetical protein
MSRKQGPRAAGMRPSAIAAGRRCDGFEIFSVATRGGSMSRKQGPRATGMRTPAHVVRVESLQGNHKYSLSYGLLEVCHGH